jgi:hypothetical protein
VELIIFHARLDVDRGRLMPDVLAVVEGALQLIPTDCTILLALNTVNGACKILDRIEAQREDYIMSEWKVFYRDSLDHDRISPSVPNKEDALAQARSLYRDKRAEIYKIEGPAGAIIAKDEAMRWVAAHMWR